MNDFNHHGWLDLPNRQGRMRDATPEEQANSYVDHKELAWQMRELHGYDYAAQQEKHDRKWAQARYRLLMAVLVAVGLALLVGLARGADVGQIPPDVPDHIRSWFKGVRSPNGVPCCNIADGHRTTWEKRPGDERYWVPIAGEWRPVPPEVVVLNAGNPVGEAVVWYVQQGENVYHIRCFVPGGGV